MTPDEYRRIMGMADASAMARGVEDDPALAQMAQEIARSVTPSGIQVQPVQVPELSDPVRVSSYDALAANRFAGQGPGLGAAAAVPERSIDQLLAEQPTGEPRTLRLSDAAQQMAAGTISDADRKRVLDYMHPGDMAIGMDTRMVNRDPVTGEPLGADGSPMSVDQEMGRGSAGFLGLGPREQPGVSLRELLAR